MEYIDYIGEDLIKLFLDKIFEECGNSSFTMAEYIKDYTLGGRRSLDTKSIMGYMEEIELLKEELKEEKKERFYWHGNSIKMKKKYNEMAEKHMKDMKKLKDNSVLFTMEDI